ncbi:hypothetical protein [Pectobacterium carotovorum]|uniref:hypothetical protein n=1 Tax=Pectobacterium carotovorum TaxID=554 RepID=UPI003015FBEB
MATNEITLTPVWQKITDGTQDASIQVLSGVMYLWDSPTQPGASAHGHVVTDWVGVTAPQQVWIRSAWGNASVVVTM